MDATISFSLAGLGAVFFLIGLWAVWRLARHPDVPAPAPSPAAPQGPSPADPVRRDRLVCIVARHDKVIQSPIAGVHIPLRKCFEDLGFAVSRAASLGDLELQLRQGVPAVMGVDCRLGPRVLREVADLAPRFPELRDCVFLFYNAERPERLSVPAALPQAHFLGLAFASQQVMEILAPAFEFREAGEEADAGAAAGARTETDGGAVFEGKVSENSLPEILQFLEIGRRTGLLSLEAEQPVGVINVRDGDIVSAQTHRHDGLEAVFEILSLGHGRFRFYPGRVAARDALRLSATEALLRWAKRMDETGEMVARGSGGSLLDTLPG